MLNKGLCVFFLLGLSACICIFVDLSGFLALNTFFINVRVWKVSLQFVQLYKTKKNIFWVVTNVGNFGMFSYGFQFLASYINSLTLQAVSIQQLLAFLVHFDPALRTAHTLAGDAPQQTLALVAVGGRGGSPHLKIVWRGAGDGVDQSLQSLLVHMVFLLN